MKRYIGALALLLLLTPAAFPASKEQQEMERDIAQLQDQVRTLQSGFDQQMATLKTLVEQALDAANKANTNVMVLTNNVTQTLDRELKESLRPVAGLTAKADNTANDVSDLRSGMTELTTQMNRMQQQLTDINNAIKVMQAPQAAPPPPAGVAGSPAAGTAGGPPPSPKDLYDNASADYSKGNAELAANEFAEFVRLYPDDPEAPQAQFYIGATHYAQHKYDQAVTDFDAVLERFPEGSKTPDAWFMKGMALKDAGHRDAAVTVWRTLIRKYSRSDDSDKAKEQLRAMGLSPTAPAAHKR